MFLGCTGERDKRVPILLVYTAQRQHTIRPERIVESDTSLADRVDQ